MVNAQEWLDKNYPCNCSEDGYGHLIHQKICKRNNVEELNLRNLNLKGSLDLEGFDNLKKTYLAGNPNLGEIKHNYRILVYQNPQEWLNHQYSKLAKMINLDNLAKKNLEFEQPGELIIDNYHYLKEAREEGFLGGREEISQITKLTISNCSRLEEINISKFKNIQELILHNLSKLNWLNCSSNNKLVTLDLSTCFDLEKVDCNVNNQLTEIKLPNNGRKLKELNLMSNNFHQDLSFLSHLVNLKELNLGNNKFTGSLEPLKDMNNLKELNISNTDIDSGLEYLPESIEKFWYPAEKRKYIKYRATKCQTIYNLFADEQGKVETDYDGYIKNFSQKLQEYKQKNANKRSGVELKHLGSEADSLVIQVIIQKEKQIEQLQEKMEKISLESEQLKTQLEQEKQKNKTLQEKLEKALTRLQRHIQETENKLELGEQQALQIQPAYGTPGSSK